MHLLDLESLGRRAKPAPSRCRGGGFHRWARAQLGAILCGLAWMMPGYAAAPEIPSSAISASGGRGSGTRFAVQGTLGQPAVQAMSNAVHTVRGGFWWAAQTDFAPELTLPDGPVIVPENGKVQVPLAWTDYDTPDTGLVLGFQVLSSPETLLAPGTVKRVEGAAALEIRPTRRQFGTGQIQVIVTDADGLSVSNALAVEVRPREILVSPDVVLRPECDSTPVVLRVSAGAASGAVYQWRLNGVNLVDGRETNETCGVTFIGGARTDTLVISNLDLTHGGAYAVAVEDKLGPVVSQPVTVRLGPEGVFGLLPSTNWSHAAQLPSLAATGGRGYADNRGAGSPSVGEPSTHAGQPARAPIWFRWVAPLNDPRRTVSFRTAGSGFDTVLAIYRGAATTPVASDDESGRFHTSEVQWIYEPGAEYFVAVDGVGAQTGDVLLSWDLEVGPAILRQPLDQRLLAAVSNEIHFDVLAQDAAGGTELDFQWQFTRGSDGQFTNLLASGETLDFRRADLLLLEVLAVKVQQSVGFAAVVRASLEPAAEAALQAWNQIVPLPETATLGLLKALNTLLRGPAFATETLRDVVLRPETRGLLATSPTGAERVRLHRLILEDAFPRDLARRTVLQYQDGTTQWLRMTLTNAVQQVGFYRVIVTDRRLPEAPPVVSRPALLEVVLGSPMPGLTGTYDRRADALRALGFDEKGDPLPAPTGQALEDGLANDRRRSGNELQGANSEAVGTILTDHWISTYDPNEAIPGGSGHSRWLTLQRPDAESVVQVDTQGSAIPMTLAVYARGVADWEPVLLGRSAPGNPGHALLSFWPERNRVYAVAVDSVDRSGGEAKLNITNRRLRPNSPLAVAGDLTPGIEGVLTVDLDGSGFDAVYAVYGGVSGLAEVPWVEFSEGGRRWLRFDAKADESYFFLVQSPAPQALPPLRYFSSVAVERSPTTRDVVCLRWKASGYALAEGDSLAGPWRTQPFPDEVVGADSACRRVTTRARFFRLIAETP